MAQLAIAEEKMVRNACESIYLEPSVERNGKLVVANTKIVLGDRVFCSVSSGFSIHYNGKKIQELTINPCRQVPSYSYVIGRNWQNCFIL